MRGEMSWGELSLGRVVLDWFSHVVKVLALCARGTGFESRSTRTLMFRTLIYTSQLALHTVSPLCQLAP